jgi:small ligand-binding sensory domain FIST
MEKLRQDTVDETILGALLITCYGRGPRPGQMIAEEMADAKRMAQAFPQVPFLGIYAGGEIGDMALAARESPFGKAKASIQGFTAVVALFLLPKANSGSTMDVVVDDTKDTIDSFIRGKLYGNSATSS